MTITTHATIGAVIGQMVGNPVLAFLIGFASHLLVDMIPHGDNYLADNFRVHKRNRKQALAYVMVDGIIALLFVLMLFETREITQVRPFTWGIIGAILPDLLVGLNDLVQKNTFLQKFSRMHFFFHDYFSKRKGDVPLRYALVGQLLFILFLQTRIG